MRGFAEPRPAYVDGSFYPAEPDRLARLADGLLAGAVDAGRPPDLEPGLVLGLLVPHAGLVYSGAIAALAWSLATEIGPSTVVIAGTDHQASAAGIGVWTGGPWQTPLGEIAIDRDLALEVASLGRPFAADDEAHFGEHSIEVQLPLMARALPEARLVALAVSPRLSSHAEAGERLGRLLAERRAGGERILLVASSDLAHYPPAAVCEQSDDELLEPLLRMDAEALRALESDIVRAGRPGLICGLCGIDPVRLSLSALLTMGATRGLLLGAATSADAGGDPRRTVGYAAAAFL
jgi:AmmeMemoRadiSam system protein B